MAMMSSIEIPNDRLAHNPNISNPFNNYFILLFIDNLFA